MTAPAPLAALLPVTEYETHEEWAIRWRGRIWETYPNEHDARSMASRVDRTGEYSEVVRRTVITTAWQDAPEETR